MSKNNSIEKGNLPWQLALPVYIFIVMGFYFIFNGFAVLVMKFYAGKIPEGTDLISNGPDAALMKNTLLYGHIGGIIAGMIIIPLLYVLFLKPDLKEAIFKPSWHYFTTFMLLAVCITFAVLPFIGIITDWNREVKLPASMQELETVMRALEDKAAEMTKLIVYGDTTGELLLVIFTVAFLPAVGEELVFRGILQNGLVRAFGNIHVAVLVSAMLFSFIHFQFFGFFPRMLLGIVLGYLYITSGNILVSMLMHFTNNAMAIIAMNLHAKGKLAMDPESSKDLPAISIYMSVIISSALFYACWRLYKQRMEAPKTNV